MQHRERFLGLLLGLAGLVLQPLAHAEEPWIFAISEGTSGNSNSATGAAKYEPLINVMRAATNHEISLVIERGFAQLEQGMKSGRYDFVMARPSDYPARGIRDYGYKMVSSTKPDGRCYIIVSKDSPFKNLKEVSHKRFVFPESVSYASKLCMAELRDQGIVVDKSTIQYVREQDGVGFAVTQKLAEVGAVGSHSTIGASWEKNGGRLLHQSSPHIYFPMIASARVSQADVAKIQAALKDLENTEAGIKLLSGLRIKGFNVENEKRLLELLKWLE